MKTSELVDVVHGDDVDLGAAGERGHVTHGAEDGNALDLLGSEVGFGEADADHVDHVDGLPLGDRAGDALEAADDDDRLTHVEVECAAYPRLGQQPPNGIPGEGDRG